MEAIWDFVRAAAPWVAMGLAVTILAVRGAKRKKATEKQDKKQAGNYGTEGMCLGMCFGHRPGKHPLERHRHRPVAGHADRVGHWFRHSQRPGGF